MIDAHCHLNYSEKYEDLDEIINRAKEKGVDRIINAGTSIERSQMAIDLAQEYDNLFAIVGIHPHDSEKAGNFEQDLDRMCKVKKVVGVGEIGLDYFANEIDPKIQKDVFSKQIEIAIKNNLPLQIHQRHAGDDVIDVLSSYKNEFKNSPGMIHCFAGSFDFLNKALDLGFYIGFDGNITYKGLAPGEDTKLSDLALKTPNDRIIVETDAPWLTPIPHRGMRNEPSYVIITADFIANLKGIPLEEFRDITVKNTENLFNLND